MAKSNGENEMSDIPKNCFGCNKLLGDYPSIGELGDSTIFYHPECKGRIEKWIADSKTEMPPEHQLDGIKEINVTDKENTNV